MDTTHLAQFALPYLQKYVPGWQDLTIDNLQVIETVGISNKTYKIFLKNSTLPIQKAIFRHFNQNLEGKYVCRKQENSIMKQLAQRQIAPLIYGAEHECRIEQYIESTVLEAHQMFEQYYRRKVALNLAILHSSQIEGIEKIESPVMKIFREGNVQEQAKKKLFDDSLFDESDIPFIKEVRNSIFNKDIEEFFNNHLPQHSDALVFSHNDLLANNILIRLIDGGINFIDFEYSAYNYRAFDIANFIVESSFDYMNPNPPFYFIGSHPDDEVINDFIKYYSYAATLISQNQLSKIQDQQYIEKIITNENFLKEEYNNINQSIFNKINQEVQSTLKVNLALSNFFWALWGTFMISPSNVKYDIIKFDYCRFVHDRFQSFLTIKSELEQEKQQN